MLDIVQESLLNVPSYIMHNCFLYVLTFIIFLYDKLKHVFSQFIAPALTRYSREAYATADNKVNICAPSPLMPWPRRHLPMNGLHTRVINKSAPVYDNTRLKCSTVTGPDLTSFQSGNNLPMSSVCCVALIHDLFLKFWDQGTFVCLFQSSLFA